MPLLRLIAEGVGPFDRLDLDFSDGHGNPHLGPHILAGVNGSGKSTALRTLAWAMDRGKVGFNLQGWRHFLDGHPRSRALALAKPPNRGVAGWASFRNVEAFRETILRDWIREAVMRELQGAWRASFKATSYGTMVADITTDDECLRLPFTLAAYAPSLSLKHLDRLDRAEVPSDPSGNCLAFETTVDNEGIQAWLRDLRSRKALAREIGKPSERYERSLGRFQAALGLVCGEGIHYEIEIEPTLQLRLLAFGQSLNFSQLPDGVRNTVGWLADFMMRQELVQWDPALKGKRPGILLLDEVDAHLHPRWQRTLLPAMRAALPDVQIIVTSHSPFVISSCPGARVHVLELDERTGRAHALPPVDAPFGGSVMATLKDIFGVSSRFDIRTERDLEEWNELLRKEAVGSLPPRDRKRLDELTAQLSQRSEELRSIVGVRQPPGRNSKSKPSKRRQRMAG